MLAVGITNGPATAVMYCKYIVRELPDWQQVLFLANKSKRFKVFI
jgi:hypothetical protein